MSCSKWQCDIALYAGDDLPAKRLARTVAHLEACAECRALADDLRAGRMLLGELRDESLEEAMSAHVRRRVMGRLVAKEGGPARRYWTWALAAIALVAVLVALPWRTEKRVIRVRVAVPQRTVVTPAAVVNVPRPIARRHHHPPARHAAPSKSGEPLLVQLVSDDPNIVIYWLVDPKPQGD